MDYHSTTTDQSLDAKRPISSLLSIFTPTKNLIDSRPRFLPNECVLRKAVRTTQPDLLEREKSPTGHTSVGLRQVKRTRVAAGSFRQACFFCRHGCFGIVQKGTLRRTALLDA